MSNSEQSTDWRVAACIARAHQWEPSLKAWAMLAEPAPAVGTGGVQHPWLPAQCGFAVKDIIDVAGLPTRFGSKVFDKAVAAIEDAPVVAALKESGAVCAGKTVSTEFAFVDPAETRNPYDLERTPGGSSSGSGAVVGARIVPFALGTQTAGSLCRPAAYCGAYAYKPTLDWWPMQGIAPLARSFDMVGPIAVSMDFLLAVHAIWAQAFGRPPCQPIDAERPLRIGLVSSPDQSPAAVVSAALDDVGACFSKAGHTVTTVQTPVSFAELIAAHRQIMLAEAARDVLPLVASQRHLLGPKIDEALRIGESLSITDTQNSIDLVAQARSLFWSAMKGFDLLMAPPVSDVAPAGLGTTGDQTYLTPWTALGGPLVNLPCGHDGSGMPLSIMLAAPPGEDAALLSEAQRLDACLPVTAPPSLAQHT